MKKQKTTLEVIEENSLNMGNREYKIHEKTESLAALRGACTAYRAAMQAIRYTILYNSVNKRK